MRNIAQKLSLESRTAKHHTAEPQGFATAAEADPSDIRYTSTGGGGSSGDNFGGENFNTSPILVSTRLQFWCRAIRHRKFKHPWFLVDNLLCETLADLEQYQLIRDKQKEQGLGWLSILKAALLH